VAISVRSSMVKILASNLAVPNPAPPVSSPATSPEARTPTAADRTPVFEENRRGFRFPRHESVKLAAVIVDEFRCGESSPLSGSGSVSMSLSSPSVTS
jgi:hypothetical protein